MTTIRMGNTPWLSCIVSYKDHTNNYTYHIIIERYMAGINTIGYNFKVLFTGEENEVRFVATTEEIEEMQKRYPDMNGFEISVRFESRQLLVSVYPDYPVISVFEKVL